MKKLLMLVWAVLTMSATTYSQNDDPKTTEVWDPEPRVVTPGVNGAAPSDAIILFDGKNLDSWTGDGGQSPKWTVADNAVTVAPGTGGIKTKQSFGDIQLHIEWRTPAQVKGDGQDRGNSGIFLQELYEIQVLDSYKNRTYANGQAGALYKQHPPLVNAVKGPGEWQAYDIVFIAPRFDTNGNLVSPARMTAFLNGILVQHYSEIKGATTYVGQPKYKAHGNAPLALQDHGNPTSFRNIWVRELK